MSVQFGKLFTRYLNPCIAALFLSSGLMMVSCSSTDDEEMAELDEGFEDVEEGEEVVEEEGFEGEGENNFSNFNEGEFENDAAVQNQEAIQELQNLVDANNGGGGDNLYGEGLNEDTSLNGGENTFNNFNNYNSPDGTANENLEGGESFNNFGENNLGENNLGENNLGENNFADDGNESVGFNEGFNNQGTGESEVVNANEGGNVFEEAAANSVNDSNAFANAGGEEVPANNYATQNTLPENNYANNSVASAGAGPSALPEDGSLMRYYVRSGDTLAKIARKIYGSSSSYTTLQQLNGISNANKIYVGDVIYYELSGETRGFASRYEGAGRSTYTVQTGDSLATIAGQLLGSQAHWRTLWKMNPGISNPDVIRTGQVLTYANVSSVADVDVNAGGDTAVASQDVEESVEEAFPQSQDLEMTSHTTAQL